MDIQIAKGESVILLITPLDTRGQGWLLTNDIEKVILTIREEEDTPLLLQLSGVVEYTGGTIDDPAKVAVKIETADTMKLPAGEYWYDVTLIKNGHWYDINEYNGLYAKVDYGRLRDDSGKWLDIKEGWIELLDDTVNFLQITKEGKYTITEADYEKDGDIYKNFNLYRIITFNGEIVDTFPYDDWFGEGAHSGLDFAYQAGKVLDDSNILQDVSVGSVTLKPDIVNYVEVTPAGVVESNITRFTEGTYSLYKVTTNETSIVDVKRQSNRFILDDRGQFVRGDSYIPCVKSKASIIWTPTKAEEESNDEEEGGEE